MKIVDARGMGCPKPVIETKKAMDAGLTEILVLVDNETASKNVSLLASKMNFEVSVEEKDGMYRLALASSERKTEGLFAGGCRETGDWVLLAGSDRMGEGSEELGKILMKGYFYALTESKPYPRAILFLNGGVRLALEHSPVLAYLQSLEQKGVEMLVCGTCLDYFNEKEHLRIGTVSNMYAIVEIMNETPKLVKL